LQCLRQWRPCVIRPAILLLTDKALFGFLFIGDHNKRNSNFHNSSKTKEVPVIPMMTSTSFVDLSRLNFGAAVIRF
jgi:hypothetical protein